MRDFFARLAGWFTETRRAAIQAFVASIITVLVMLGATTADQGTALAALVASLLLAAQGLIGLALLRPSDWYTWLNETGRGVVYALGLAIGGAGVAFNLFTPETSGVIVQVATAVASILVAAVQMMNVGTIADAGSSIVPAQADRHAVLASVAEKYGYVIAPKLADADAATLSADLAVRGWAVGVYAPEVAPLESLRPITDLNIGRVDILDVFADLLSFRGTRFDLILSTVPLTREILDALGPYTVTSEYPGDRVRFIGATS
ncbi:hypothetical protein [Microbacterium rhizomatis]|uniref:Uncharacterized protein n=1 Tax=Microbacterium rhizomatis TaxID=1631477 RepID=A0A5J5J244_9MICO|nr:hypothetical protein [Microbacterium rhizomatis]KAA9110171.1 hypothetical protein F6B43_00215 [Microbacterium rhizomatis]